MAEAEMGATMSEEAASNPEASNPLLEAADRDPTDLLIPAAVGLAGVALLFTVAKKKKKESAPAPKVNSDQVSFSADFTTHRIGDGWEDTVLEPYLADQAEEGVLTTISDEPNLSPDVFRAKMESTRKEVLDAFAKTHKVKVPSGDKLISDLPDKPKVRDFLNFIQNATVEFQGYY
jgi:hypothetical protein